MYCCMYAQRDARQFVLSALAPRTLSAMKLEHPRNIEIRTYAL